jgi:hypothetical protein
MCVSVPECSARTPLPICIHPTYYPIEEREAVFEATCR